MLRENGFQAFGEGCLHRGNLPLVLRRLLGGGLFRGPLRGLPSYSRGGSGSLLCRRLGRFLLRPRRLVRRRPFRPRLVRRRPFRRHPLSRRRHRGRRGRIENLWFGLF